MTADESPTRTTRGDVYIVVALAVSSVLFAVLYSASSIEILNAPLWASALASVLLTAPLLYRRRYPSQSAFVICLVYSVALVNSAMEIGVSQIILFLGIYSIGPWQRSRRVAFWSRLLLCIGMAVLFTVSLTVQFRALGDFTVLQFAASGGVSFLTNVAFFGGAWVFGNRAWKQRKLMADLRAANDEVREQEQQLARQAVDLERVRIARELHDGVAHHIAGVGIHAAAARRSLERNPDKAKESLQVIESSTRETVDELRALVYTLRDTDSSTEETSATDDTAKSGDRAAEAPNDNATAASTKGNPSLGDLPELIESARRFDQTVEYATIGDPRPLTPITEMSIYRVIQESLTNCSRYAGAGAEVDVRLRYGSTGLEVEVSDTRSAGRPSTGSNSVRSDSGPRSKSEGLGLGIVGMRERMNALGGNLEAGPKSRGGWIVRARIPYPRSTAERSSPDTPAKAST
ncbi:sensor histidine kinase [Brevibacterium permense]|uniref:sensor histidine kinase n=1 Tax=Brevibacterium permense TaxID=234834 RepID=UPI0021D37F8A|nr:sensor histidine kinase [Brevibacterium permense]MCU4297513.1 sensor histidine kinase [Brevibacterium permense]